MRIETTAVHAGRHPDPATGAVSQPIYLSTTFERTAEGEYPRGFIYSRDNNPNRKALEECLAALEGGSEAILFASGLAVATAVVQSLGPGAHIIAPDDVYWGLRKVIGDVFGPWNLAVSYVDMSNAEAVRAAIRAETRLIWTETPSNPLMKITDLAGVAEIARQAGPQITTVCDGTFATPVLQRPFEFGIHLVAHSTTKYLSGHSDVIGGVLIRRDASPVFDAAWVCQKYGGGVPSPFDCWLTLRGIETLPYRVRGQSENAAKVARFLSEHAEVEAVHYPGLPGHPGYDIAQRQMAGGGGMLSFQIRGGRDAAMAAAARCRLFIRATSLGGTHSLIEHRASVEGPTSRTPQNLLRLSIGLEHADDLIGDLTQALQQ